MIKQYENKNGNTLTVSELRSFIKDLDENMIIHVAADGCFAGCKKLEIIEDDFFGIVLYLCEGEEEMQ